MRSFLKKSGHYPGEDEIAAIMRRIDSDGDCLVSYADFSEALKPQEFSLKED